VESRWVNKYGDDDCRLETHLLGTKDMLLNWHLITHKFKILGQGSGAKASREDRGC
jgi:hypothetical protein